MSSEHAPEPQGETIRVERRGRVLLARLDNPPHGLMTLGMMAELDTLVRGADADRSVGAVVLTGAHPDVFLAHFDVGELLRTARSAPPVSERQAAIALRLVRGLSRVPGMASALDRTPLAGVLAVQRFHDTLTRMGRSGTVYVAAINGHTAGGGLELALACDVRLLVDDGELAQPELLVGFPPGGGGTQRLARLIGRGAALEIMLSGRGVDADEARALGIVHALEPPDRLTEAACERAAQLARRHKAGASVVKRAVLEGGSLPLPRGLQTEQAGFLAMLGRRPVQAAMERYVAFLDRTGGLPALDPEARRQLQDGEFSDLT